MRLKQVSAGILAALLCMAMSACSTGDAAGATPMQAQETPGAGIVRILHIWPEHSQSMQRMLESVQQNLPEGTVLKPYAVHWNDVRRSVQAAAAAQNLFEVFFQFSIDVPIWRQAGVSLDLTPYLQADPQWLDSFIQPHILQQFSAQGRVYGVPFRGSGVFVLYNVDLFARNGWKVPATQEEMVELMEEIAKASIQPLAVAGKPDGFQMMALRGMVTNHILQAAGELDAEDVRLARRTEWNGQLARGARLVKTWYNHGYFGNPFAIEREEAQILFLSGQAAMLLCNNNEFYELKQQSAYTPFAMKSFLFPAPRGVQTVFTNSGFNDGFAVSALTDDPDRAVQVLKGMTGRQAEQIFVQDTYSIAPIKEIVYPEQMLKDFSNTFSNHKGFYIAPDYDATEVNELQSQLFVEFMTSSMTADEFESNWEAIVKDATT